MDDLRRDFRRLERASGQVPDLNDPAWRGLLVAYLDAEPRIHWVINDFLREMRCATIKPGGTEHRVRAVIGVLPAVRAHRVAVAMADHAVQARPQPMLTRCLDAKRAWLEGTLQDAHLKALRREVHNVNSWEQPLALGIVSVSPSPSVPQGVTARALNWAGNTRREVRWQHTALRDDLHAMTG